VQGKMNGCSLFAYSARLNHSSVNRCPDVRKPLAAAPMITYRIVVTAILLAFVLLCIWFAPV
jgi:hypothetical protein